MQEENCTETLPSYIPWFTRMNIPLFRTVLLTFQIYFHNFIFNHLMYHLFRLRRECTLSVSRKWINFVIRNFKTYRRAFIHSLMIYELCDIVYQLVCFKCRTTCKKYFEMNPWLDLQDIDGKLFYFQMNLDYHIRYYWIVWLVWVINYVFLLFIFTVLCRYESILLFCTPSPFHARENTFISLLFKFLKFQNILRQNFCRIY